MRSTQFFRVKSISLSRATGKKPQTLREAASHNLREIQAERRFTERIDPLRSALNIVITGPDSAAGVVALAERLLKGVSLGGRKALRRDHCQAIEAVFSVPIRFAGAEAFLTKCVEWAEGALGLPLLSAVIHLDQAEPHVHVLFLPVIDGHHVGSSPIARARTARLREQFFRELAGPAGLKRDGGKLQGAAKLKAAETVRAECSRRGLDAVAGNLWEPLCDAINADPTGFMEALDAERLSAVHEENSIGFEQNSIEVADGAGDGPLPASAWAIEGTGQDQTLSCVGFPVHHLPPKAPSVPPARPLDHELGTLRSAPVVPIRMHVLGAASTFVAHPMTPARHTAAC